MEALAINTKNFQLVEKGQLLGELFYENLFSEKATIKLPNAENYLIKPRSIFKTTIDITKNETEIGSFKMNWRGQIEFVFQDGQEFILKGKGFFHNKYTLENKNGEKLMEFKPQFVWRKFRYNYSIHLDNKPIDDYFVLLVVYATNYIIATASSASSGMG